MKIDGELQLCENECDIYEVVGNIYDNPELLKEVVMEKKYKLTSEELSIGHTTLYRIKALKNFGEVKEGDLGGWIEKESNLSHEGNCWIYEDAKVYDDAKIYNNAEVYGAAEVFGNAEIYGAAWVFGDARVYGDTKVFGNVEISGNARVYSHAEISGDVEIYNNAEICGNVKIFGTTKVFGGVIC